MTNTITGFRPQLYNTQSPKPIPGQTAPVPSPNTQNAGTTGNYSGTPSGQNLMNPDDLWRILLGQTNFSGSKIVTDGGTQPNGTGGADKPDNTQNPDTIRQQAEGMDSKEALKTLIDNKDTLDADKDAKSGGQMTRASFEHIVDGSNPNLKKLSPEDQQKLRMAASHFLNKTFSEDEAKSLGLDGEFKKHHVDKNDGGLTLFNLADNSNSSKDRDGKFGFDNLKKIESSMKDDKTTDDKTKDDKTKSDKPEKNDKQPDSIPSQDQPPVVLPSQDTQYQQYQQYQQPPVPPPPPPPPVVVTVPDEGETGGQKGQQGNTRNSQLFGEINQDLGDHGVKNGFSDITSDISGLKFT